MDRTRDKSTRLSSPRSPARASPQSLRKVWGEQAVPHTGRGHCGRHATHLHRLVSFARFPSVPGTNAAGGSTFEVRFGVYCPEGTEKHPDQKGTYRFKAPVALGKQVPALRLGYPRDALACVCVCVYVYVCTCMHLRVSCASACGFRCACACVRARASVCVRGSVGLLRHGG